MRKQADLTCATTGLVSWLQGFWGFGGPSVRVSGFSVEGLGLSGFMFSGFRRSEA